ncbi:hypothetical protein VNI00_000526 [Paramarasmius palmivorus]|uniref:Uncharacterized protein n=1 Tax=Paramarasmius palmivorus TaxID=297713 RepID=A0AAW0EBH8_9AGAR
MKLAISLISVFVTVASALAQANVGIISPTANLSVSNQGARLISLSTLLNITLNPGRSVKAFTTSITAYLIPAGQSQLVDGQRVSGIRILDSAEPNVQFPTDSENIHTAGYEVEVDLSRWSNALANGAETPWKLWIEEKYTEASPFDFAIWAQGINIEPQ